MNNIGIIFDLDGTMVENIHIHARCWKAASHKFDIDVNEDIYLKRITGHGRRHIVKSVLCDFLSENQAEELYDYKEILYREEFVKELRLIEGLERFLQELHSNNIPMMIASNAPIKNVEACHTHLNLKQFGLNYLTPNDQHQGKPAPDLFLHSAELMGVTPQNCLVFEDSTTGFMAAEASNMSYIAVTLEKEPAPEFKPLLKIKNFNSININLIREALESLRSDG